MTRPETSHSRRRWQKSIPAAALSAGLVACASGAAWAETPKVVTDILPVHSLVAQVMGDLGTPDVIIGSGADPHHFQLRPSQMRSLTAADLVIWVGPELTPWLERTLGSGDPASQLVLLAEGGGTARRLGDDGPVDPHAWLDPENARAWLSTIAAALGRADPDHAAQYAANARAAADAITVLQAETQATLADAKAPIAVDHDAIGYFAARFGLTVAGTVRGTDDAGPGAAHLAALHDLFAAGQVACFFPAFGEDPKEAQMLIADTPVRLGGAIDPEGLQLTAGPDLYRELITNLAETIKECAAGKSPSTAD